MIKEKILDFMRVISYYPRKLVDICFYNLYFKKNNDWSILNEFSNRPILIAGNGPSLNKTPLGELKKTFVSIGMNKINLIYEKTSWKPDIITCVNGLIISQNKQYFNTSEKILILPVKAFYLGIKPRKNILFVNLKDKNEIGIDLKQGISTGCTVTFTALQIAANLEPKSVNIVGVDHSYKVKEGPLVQKFEGEDLNHFSTDYFKNQYWGLPDLDGSEKLYLLARKHFESRTIPIIDYTVEGKLEIFKKGKITDLLS